MAQYAADTAQAGASSSSAHVHPVILSAFATTTVFLGCIFAGFIVPNLSASLSFFAAIAFFGGLVQLLLGMRSEANPFTAYGAFLMTLGAIFAPSLSISNSVSHPLLGLLLLTWTIFSGIVALSTLRANLSTIVINILLFLAYLLLTIGELSGGVSLWLAIGGWLAIVCGLVAWYVALADLLSTSHGILKLPTW